jgi:CheY-like chemotaxis protein
MAHILIFHPDDAVRLALRRAIEPAGHVVEHLGDGREVVGLVEHQEAIHDPFDLLLLADATLMADLGHRADHGVALIGTVATDPRVLGTVDPAGDIVAQLLAVLARRERYLGRLGEWDQAADYLGVVGFAEQRAAVAAHRPAVPFADPAEPAVTKAFQVAEDAANAALQHLPGELSAALAPLAPYQATPSFWTQLRHAYAHERVRALALLATLRRLDADKLAHGRVVAPGHFTLPVGGTHQVFFRWANGRRVLEAFVPAKDAAATTERLTHAPEPPVPLVESVPV